MLSPIPFSTLSPTSATVVLSCFLPFPSLLSPQPMPQLFYPIPLSTLSPTNVTVVLSCSLPFHYLLSPQPMPQLFSPIPFSILSPNQCHSCSLPFHSLFSPQPMPQLFCHVLSHFILYSLPNQCHSCSVMLSPIPFSTLSPTNATVVLSCSLPFHSLFSPQPMPQLFCHVLSHYGHGQWVCLPASRSAQTA